MNVPELPNWACGLIVFAGLMFAVFIALLVELQLDKHYDVDEEE